MNWVAIQGLQDHEISACGKVRRLFADGSISMLKVQTCPCNGYPIVCFSINKKKYTRTLHRMLALAFIGPPPSPLHEVLHRDGVKTNFALTNLRWGTKLENAQDKLRHGIDKRGVKNVAAKLTDEQVSVIRESGLTITELAAQYSVARATIRKIRRHQSYIPLPSFATVNS